MAAGDDSMIDIWEDWAGRMTDDPRADWLAALVSRLPDGARVVELVVISEPEGAATFQWVLARR